MSKAQNQDKSKRKQVNNQDVMEEEMLEKQSSKPKQQQLQFQRPFESIERKNEFSKSTNQVNQLYKENLDQILNGFKQSNEHRQTQFLRRTTDKKQNKTGKQKDSKQQNKKNQKSQKELEAERERAQAIRKADIKQQDQVTLVDWAIRGPSEKIRLVLEFINIPYKQKKYTIATKDQWLKQDMKQIVKLNPLATTLPYLRDGNKIITNPNAIIVYILNKYERTELLGRNIHQKTKLATMDRLYDQLYRIFQDLSYGRYDSEDDWQKVKIRYMKQKMKPIIEKIGSFVKYKMYLCGATLTWIDLAVADLMHVLNLMDEKIKDYHLQLNIFCNKIFRIYQLEDYRKSLRFHERPINGIGAIFK